MKEIDAVINEALMQNINSMDETNQALLNRLVKLEGELGAMAVNNEALKAENERLREALSNICGRGGYTPATDYKREVKLMQGIAKWVLEQIKKEG